MFSKNEEFLLTISNEKEILYQYNEKIKKIVFESLFLLSK